MSGTLKRAPLFFYSLLVLALCGNSGPHTQGNDCHLCISICTFVSVYLHECVYVSVCVCLCVCYGHITNAWYAKWSSELSSH